MVDRKPRQHSEVKRSASGREQFLDSSAIQHSSSNTTDDDADAMQDYENNEPIGELQLDPSKVLNAFVAAVGGTHVRADHPEGSASQPQYSVDQIIQSTPDVGARAVERSLDKARFDIKYRRKNIPNS